MPVFVSSSGAVNVDVTTTGVKNIATFSPGFGAGANIVIVAINVLYSGSPARTGNNFRFEVRRGSTVLANEGFYTPHYADIYIAGANRYIFFIESAAPANASYDVVLVNNLAVSGVTLTVQVNFMAIQGVEAYDYVVNIATPVTIAAGATATIVSKTMTLSTGKYVVLAMVEMQAGSTYAQIQAGAIRLKRGLIVLASNEFVAGGVTTGPRHMLLVYLDNLTTANPTYSIEFYNSSSYTYSVVGRILAFKIIDGAYVDSTGVLLSTTAETTIANLNTTLTGDVAVIAVTQFDITSNTLALRDVVLEGNHRLYLGANSVASNTLKVQLFESSNDNRRWTTFAHFYLAIGVSSPSFSVRTLANVGSLYGEAKILAFVLPVVVSVTDSGVGVETVSVTAQAFATDSSTGFETINIQASLEITDLGLGTELIDMMKEAIDTGAGVEFTTAGTSQPIDDAAVGSETIDIQTQIPASDAGIGSELVNMMKEAIDTSVGSELVSMAKEAFDTGSGVEIVDMTKDTFDAGSGSESVSSTKEALDAGVGSELVSMAKEAFDTGVGSELVSMTKEAFDTGSGSELIIPTKEALDAGSGLELVDMTKESVDISIGFELVSMAKDTFDAGSGVELVSMTKETFDAGIGLESVSPIKEVSDTGVGSELVSMTKEVVDTSIGSELVNMRKEAFDTGAGVETVNSPQFNVYVDAGTGVDAGVIIISRLDSGVGVETITMSKEVLDSGAGVEAITFMLKGLLDTGLGIEQATIRAFMSAIDAGAGVDTALLVGTIIVITDTGTSVELVETFLSAVGNIFVDGIEIIGRHSIPYQDLTRDGLPIQTQRRAVDDRVYVDSAEVGTVLVEWEDKVTDVMPGSRILHVIGVVRLVD